MTLIGRKKESTILHKAISSNRAEFLAVYGRRRIGKTYLIQQCTSGKGIYLEYTGLKDGPLKVQLANFAECFAELFDNASLFL